METERKKTDNPDEEISVRNPEEKPDGAEVIINGPEADEADFNNEPVKGKKEKEKDKKLSHREQKELESLRSQLEEKNNQYLRLAAEYDNYRKRTEREKSDCYVSAYGDALKAFLPLMDVLYQAQQFTPDDKGISALVKQAEDILSKLGIAEMKTDGEPFDPNYHNAVMHEDNPDLGENTVTQTFQRGYMLGDRVLRPAMVKVAN